MAFLRWMQVEQPISEGGAQDTLIRLSVRPRQLETIQLEMSSFSQVPVHSFILDQRW